MKEMQVVRENKKKDGGVHGDEKKVSWNCVWRRGSVLKKNEEDVCKNGGYCR